jgi:hypothetical protein
MLFYFEVISRSQQPLHVAVLRIKRKKDLRQAEMFAGSLKYRHLAELSRVAKKTEVLKGSSMVFK